MFPVCQNNKIFIGWFRKKPFFAPIVQTVLIPKIFLFVTVVIFSYNRVKTYKVHCNQFANGSWVKTRPVWELVIGTEKLIHQKSIMVVIEISTEYLPF